MFIYFFQVFYMHINFSINILLMYFSRIVSWILKISRIHVPVSYRTRILLRIRAS